VIAVPHNILVIDDSPLILAVTAAALENAGYSVTTALTLEAFEAARLRAPPDLIILDVQMPEIFGDDLAATLRGVYEESAPIVLLSNLDEEELATRAKEANARAWVTKRAGMGALLAKVSELLTPGAVQS
jgi:DNA-binding response OmpR family regulator